MGDAFGYSFPSSTRGVGSEPEAYGRAITVSSICYLSSMTDSPPASLGTLVRSLRTARGMSQAQLGRPRTRAWISLIEHDRALPSVRTLLAIADRIQRTS